MGAQYYDLLGVSPDASTEEIASAYRERLKEIHPDVNDASDAGERTKRLIEAKEALTDETERARYDKLGHERYVSIEHGRTPDHSPDPNAESSPKDTRGEADSDPGNRSSGAGADDDGPNRATSDEVGNTGTGSESAQKRGAESRRRGERSRGAGTDWGTRGEQDGTWTASHEGIHWEERSQTDWDAVSEAVWEEVTGGESRASQGAASGWGTAASGADATTGSQTADRSGGRAEHSGTAPPDWGGSGSDGESNVDEGSRDQQGTANSSENATAGGVDATSERTAAGAGSGAATAAARAHTGSGNTAATTGPGVDERGDWTVGWYSGGDSSGTAHDAWSVGESSEVRRTWSPGADTSSRYRGGTFPPHRILSPVQTVTLFCLCFVTYPLLIGGAVFPLFNLPVRLMLALFLVFVVALLIVLPQLGVAVFGSWMLLFPMAFTQLGVAVVAPLSLLTLSAVTVSLGLAALSWLLTRPPVL